jgi:hypothetical protein
MNSLSTINVSITVDCGHPVHKADNPSPGIVGIDGYRLHSSTTSADKWKPEIEHVREWWVNDLYELKLRIIRKTNGITQRVWIADARNIELELTSTAERYRGIRQSIVFVDTLTWDQKQALMRTTRPRSFEIQECPDLTVVRLSTVN